MPGERQYITGPCRISGAIALHMATSAEPMMTGGLPARICVASCTATCGLLWSSWKAKVIPADFPSLAAKRSSARCSALPRKAAGPVSGSTTSIVIGSAAQALAIRTGAIRTGAIPSGAIRNGAATAPSTAIQRQNRTAIGRFPLSRRPLVP